MKKYIAPKIEVDPIEEDMLTTSEPKEKDKKPGWGPNKDSDEDGHTVPPGQNKHDDYIEDDYFSVF